MIFQKNIDGKQTKSIITMDNKKSVIEVLSSLYCREENSGYLWADPIVAQGCATDQPRFYRPIYRPLVLFRLQTCIWSVLVLK